MTTKQEARRAIQKRLGAKQDILRSWPAYLGNENGTVGGSRSGYVYVRYPSATSPAVEVFNGGVPEVAGLRVMVGYRAERPDLIQALGAADVRLEVNTTNVYGTLQAHASQHAWYGGDPVYINWRQITPLGVFGMNPPSFYVQVQPGHIPRPGADTDVDYQTVDLSSHVPASGARYALISLDSTGTVVVTDGTINAGGVSALTNADIPDTPAGNWRSAAVALYLGQAAIVENSTENDFYDLRFPEETTAGVVYPASIALTDAHIIVGDATDYAADVAMSGDATMANTGALTLKNTGPGATGPIGSATIAPIVTIDAQGRITALSSATISPALDALSDVTTTGTGAGDIIYNNAGTWEDYPLGVGTKITADASKVKIGGIAGSDYFEIDTTTGSVRLIGDATAWDDLRVSADVVKPGATAPNYKAFGPSGNLQALMFEAGHHDEAMFGLQIPHQWKVGTNIYPHVHWTPTTADAGNVVWELEYSWSNIDGTFGAPSNMASDATAAGGTAWVHKLTDLKESGNNYISGSGKTMSSMLLCRIHRNSNSGSDTLNKDVALLEIDFHFEIDSFGSNTRDTKDDA